MPNPIVHFEIMGSDTVETQRFYSELFGWGINSENPAGYGLAVTQDEDGLGINGGIGGADQGGGVRVTVYAQVDDPQTYLDKAVAMGATVLMGATQVPGMPVVVALFADPDGNTVGLVKQG